jgi:hypothetical protein
MMATKESTIVEIASQEELSKFLKDFANGGGIGVERNGDRYFVFTAGEKAKRKEIRLAFRGDMDEAQYLLEQIEYCFGAPRTRTSAETQLNRQYNTQ